MVSTVLSDHNLYEAIQSLCWEDNQAFVAPLGKKRTMPPHRSSSVFVQFDGSVV